MDRRWGGAMDRRWASAAAAVALAAVAGAIAVGLGADDRDVVTLAPAASGPPSTVPSAAASAPPTPETSASPAPSLAPESAEDAPEPAAPEAASSPSPSTRAPQPPPAARSDAPSPSPSPTVAASTAVAREAFAFDAAYGTDDPREVIVQYGDSGSCPHRRVTHVVRETSDRVVVTLEADRQDPQACTADYQQRLVRVALQQPIGDRVLVDGSRGEPVPVDRSCSRQFAQPPPPRDCEP